MLLFTAIQFPEPNSYIRIIVAVLSHWGLGNMIVGLTSSCQWAPLTLLLVNAHTIRLLVLQLRHLAHFSPSYLHFGFFPTFTALIYEFSWFALLTEGRFITWCLNTSETLNVLRVSRFILLWESDLHHGSLRNKMALDCMYRGVLVHAYIKNRTRISCVFAPFWWQELLLWRSCKTKSHFSGREENVCFF